MWQNRVLFADNERDFLETRAEYLESAGYLVLKAYSLEQARQFLAESRVHLAVLDIRLVDDDDERDLSGLTLAKDSAFSAVPKIILTGFPTYQAVREVLGPVVEGLPPAVDFLDKREGPEAMLHAVERALVTYASLNWQLTIRWAEQLSFVHLISLIDPHIDNAYILDRMGELEDLFRRSFYDSRQITISRLLTRQQKRFILAVTAFSVDGLERQFIIACGPRVFIQQEARVFETLTPKASGEGGIVEVKFVETIHFAAIVYVLHGGNLEDITTLTEFYRDSPVEMVTTALNHLFSTTLAPWYEQGRLREGDKALTQFLLEELALTEEALTPSELGRRFSTICQEGLAANLVKIYYATNSLTLQLADGSSISYPNPVGHLAEKRFEINLPVLTGTTYRQLNGDSLLVDRQGHTWLIDFSRVSRSPLLLDFVSLEVALKFDLLTTPNVLARYEMERRLLNLSRLDAAVDIEDVEPEVAKSLQAICRVRSWASSLIGREMEAYLLGLLFYTVSQLITYDATVRYTRRELIAYLHRVLSAAMLCQKLTPAPPAHIPANLEVWIDEANKEVWVEYQRVELAPTEYELMLTLYRQANQLCTRQMISQAVYHINYDKLSMDDTINALVSRLRERIEPNPRHPRYIINVRGLGYKLRLNHDPASE
jgi:DNA-binding response OmpR family regulator